MTPVQIVTNFYKIYLGSSFKPNEPRPQLKFSNSFNRLVEKNKKICLERAGTDLCGWGAGGDIYLNSQEYLPENSEKAGLVVKDIGSGKILAKFNVYPSIKIDEKRKELSYEREVIFKMIKKKDEWLVDDIIYRNESARSQISKEIQFYQKSKK
jgi:hypothetical protein